MSKPNGPIRRWLDKVGILSSRSSEESVPTAELPQPDPDPESEPELLTQQEIEISTADTMPLPPEMAEQVKTESHTDEEKMESKVVETESAAPGMTRRGSGPLLDLGDFEPAHAAAEEDFVLDLDLDTEPEPAPSTVSTAQSSYQGSENKPATQGEAASMADATPVAVAEPSEPTVDPMAETQEMMRPEAIPAPRSSERTFAEPAILGAETLRMPKSMMQMGGEKAPEELSPETIDAIARRAVEMLSERVVQEIAWEVVPQLAELLIKRQLEEKNS